MRGILRASERDAIFRDAEFQSSDGQTHFEADEQDAPHGGKELRAARDWIYDPSWHTEGEQLQQEEQRPYQLSFDDLPDHDYLQHNLGDDEDWGVQRTAAGDPGAAQAGGMAYQKPAPGSSHGAEIHQDVQGGQWLVKKPPPSAPFMADMDVAAGQIATKSGLEAPTMFKTPTGASAQQMYPGAKDAFPGKVNPEKLSDPDLLAIQKHHALDWLVSNHDDHKANFIRTPDGKLVGIDKGQAMKFINNDRLAWNFFPNEQEPIHNTLYRNFAQGGRQLLDPRQGELGKYIQGLQDMPNAEYREMLLPYAQGAAKAGQLGTDWNTGQYTNHLGQPVVMGPKRFEPNDIEGFLKAAVGRKNSLMHDFGDLYDKALAHRATGTKIAAVRLLAELPDPATLRPLHQQVGGQHDSRLYADPQGKWLIKRPNAGNEFAVPLDVATAALQAHSGLQSPETYAVPMRDGLATGVKWMPGATQAFRDLPHLGDVSEPDKLELQKHHALDWLLANYDANVGNFMRTPQGGLVGIDKGQAFKYFGQDKLDYNFRPIYYGPEPIHNKMWREFAHGHPGEMLDPRQGELGEYVKGLQSMPDWQLRSMFAPFAHSAANAGMLATGSYSHGGFGPHGHDTDPHRGLSEPTIPPNDPGQFLDALVARKNSLSKDLGDFYDRAAAERKISQLGPKLGPEEAPHKHWAPQHHYNPYTPQHHYTPQHPGNNPYNQPTPYQSKMPWAKKPKEQPQHWAPQGKHQPVWQSKEYQAKPTLFDDEWGED
jgi:hypothetical protein